MATAATDWDTKFTSTFDHGVDDKRRLQIPSRWRPPEPGFEFTLVAWPKGVNGAVYLSVLTPAQVNRQVDKINGKEERNEITPDEAASLRRLIFGRAHSVKLDTAGRICIPENMANAAALEDKAKLVGAGERFEIWNPDRYAEKLAEEQQFEPDALKVLSL